MKTDLQADPPAPPVALYVSGFHERSNGYYANRVINNEYTPTNGDRWRICGLDDSQFRQVDTVWYNGSKQRWEMYCWTGDSHQYAYSSATTEKWPDDADLLWYWGDRGYMSSNSQNDAGSIVGRSDEPISRYLTTKGLTLEDTSANYYFGQKLYSLRNSFNYEGRTPNLEDRFAIISTYDNAYRGSMEIRHDDSGYYWQIGKYVNNEYDSRLTKNVYCPPVATLEEMKWPWEIAEWACTHPGGGGGGVICAPLAFGVSDDDSITQAVGSYNSQTASGSAGYPGANSVWTCATRDINVENLGTPTYYDRFISADGRAVIFLNADLGNINNGCRWVMRFPMYGDTGTAEDRYQRYNIAYQSASMDQRSPKWPWEVAWETPNTSYWPEPAPSFIKGSGATGGLYWGDRVFVKAKNSTDNYELPFLGGKQLPSVVNGTYAYSIYVDNQKVKIDSDFNGEFYLAPELLTWENFEGYDAAYKSRKTDKRQWYQPPDGGGSVEYGEDGAFGVILGKFNKAAGNWTWLFGYFSYTAGGIDTKPHYERNGQSPVGSSWECTFIVDAANPEAVKVESVSGAVDQMAVAPNLVPKASDFWEGTVDGNAWSISWNSITKRYEAAVLGANFESNAIAVDESGNPKLFPWEYKAYEFSGWSPGIVTGRMIESFTWQGSRIVINGVAQYSGNGGHDVNGSYVSLYADPENYAYDSTNKNWCWFNKYGCRFGRWNNSSTGWALNSRDATFFSVYAANTDKLPWKDEDFSNDSSYNYGPSNFLVNGRPLDNPTGFTSAVDVIKCDADLKGRYVLVGYRTIVADGGFAELVYRKADNGSRLVWDGTKWVLYGPDQTDWYTASSSDQLRYPQDQTLTWEVGIAGEGSNSNLPLIVAVPGETKLPKANRTVLTVAGAGTADANGTYNPVDGVDAFGSSMIWLKSDGTYKIWCNAISGAVANWLIGEANSIIGKYLLFDSPAADGAIEGPYTEDGSSKTWQVAAGGTAPAPTVTAVIAKDTIILSGASPEAINGEYELIDDTAEGDERIWTNGTYFVARGTSYTVWMVRSVDGRPSDPGSGNVYFYGSDTSKANPYNDDGTSYDWYSMYGSGTLSVAKG